MPVLALAMFAVLFLVAFVARTIIQKRRTGDTGLRAGALKASAGSIEWFAGWMLLLSLVAAVAGPVAQMVGLDPLVDTLWVRGTGLAVAVAGTAVTFLAQLSMGDQWRIGIDAEEETDLVTSGPFAIVRNPIFSALILAAFGLTLMVPNAVSIAGFLLFIVAIEMQIRSVEEPYLQQLHGHTYSDYSNRVGRLIPGIGRS